MDLEYFCLKPSPDQDGGNEVRMYSIGPAVLEEIGYRQTHILLLYIGDKWTLYAMQMPQLRFLGFFFEDEEAFKGI